jgi:hypothetical protein
MRCSHPLAEPGSTVRAGGAGRSRSTVRLVRRSGEGQNWSMGVRGRRDSAAGREAPKQLVHLAAARSYRYREQSKPASVIQEESFRLAVVAGTPAPARPSDRGRWGKGTVTRVLPGVLGLAAHPTSRRLALTAVRWIAHRARLAQRPAVVVPYRPRALGGPKRASLHVARPPE